MSKTSAAPELDIFAPAKPVLRRVPDIRIQSPSQPTKSSEAGSDYIDPFRRPQWKRILVALNNANRCLSREELHERTGIPITSLCGRLSTAELRLLWVERVEDACVSSSRIEVDGFRLTAQGRALFRSDHETAILNEWGAKG